MSFCLAPRMPVSWAAPSVPFPEVFGPKERVLRGGGASGQGTGYQAPASSPAWCLPKREGAGLPTLTVPLSPAGPQALGPCLILSLRLGESTDCGHTDLFWRNST